MTRGAGWFSPPKALVRKRSAAAASRLAERRKSIVAPVESTARYKYTHLPFTRTYVSSTLQESFVVLSRLRRRRSNSGACRWTQAPDGDVIHREPTLGQKLLDIAVRKREAQIPADRQENDLRFKLAPLEQAANRRVQKEHPISLSRQACELQLFQMPSWEDVFRDEVSIDLGSDFVSTLVTTIATCDLLVAIVDSACFGNRFDDETDFVRRELLLALTTRRTLVPVVMEGVHWPPQRPLPEEAGNVGQLQAIMHVTQAQPVALRI